MRSTTTLTKWYSKAEASIVSHSWYFTHYLLRLSVLTISLVALGTHELNGKRPFRITVLPKSRKLTYSTPQISEVINCYISWHRLQPKAFCPASTRKRRLRRPRARRVHRALKAPEVHKGCACPARILMSWPDCENFDGTSSPLAGATRAYVERSVCERATCECIYAIPIQSHLGYRLV